MTPEQRLDRMENILRSCIRAGRESRTEFRQKVNILIDMHAQNEEHWRAQSNDLNEKINILIHAQMETTQQINELTKSQMQTDRTLVDFIERHRKGGNGNSSS